MQLRGNALARDGVRGRLVHSDYFEEWLAVLLVVGERAHGLRNLGAHEIGLAAHQRGDRCRETSPPVAIVRLTEGHQQRAQVCIAKTERTVQMAVLRDRLRGVVGRIDDDLLGKDRQRDGSSEILDLEISLGR